MAPAWLAKAFAGVRTRDAAGLACFAGRYSARPDRELDPRAFRNVLLRDGALLIRDAVDPQTLGQIKELLDNLFDEYAANGGRPPVDAGFVGDDWEQVQRGHVFDRIFRAVTGRSYFTILRESGLWDLAARAFPEAQIAESAVCNCRRMTESDLRRFWDKPLEFHVDAQFFYDHMLSINFWTPLDPCGVAAPSLKVVLLGVARTKRYLEYNAAGYDPTPRDIALMHRFRCTKMDLDALARNGLLEKVAVPEFDLGDVLAFTNFTMHATHCTAAMTQPRLSVELRVDLPGYRLP